MKAAAMRKAAGKGFPVLHKKHKSVERESPVGSLNANRMNMGGRNEKKLNNQAAIFSKKHEKHEEKYCEKHEEKHCTKCHEKHGMHEEKREEKRREKHEEKRHEKRHKKHSSSAIKGMQEWVDEESKEKKHEKMKTHCKTCGKKHEKGKHEKKHEKSREFHKTSCRICSSKGHTTANHVGHHDKKHEKKKYKINEGDQPSMANWRPPSMSQGRGLQDNSNFNGKNILGSVKGNFAKRHEKKRKEKGRKPTGAHGRAAVHALGRTRTTGNFARIESKYGKGAAINAYQNALRAHKARI